MLYQRRRNFRCPKICQWFHSSPSTLRDTGERIFAYGILQIFGGQKMKIIKKYIYPHKSQTILNTLAKTSLRNSIHERSVRVKKYTVANGTHCSTIRINF